MPAEDEKHAPASVAYRYRKWTLAGNSDITVVARTTIHAVSRKAGTPKYISAWTVNEWDSKLSGAPDYRRTLDSQRGALIGTEIRNNAAKLAKFAVTVSSTAAPCQCN